MSTYQDSFVGSYEARTRFAELLELVEGGQEITITRHGVPVARLIPVQRTTSAAERREAIVAMRELSRQNRLEGVKIKDLIEEGRR